MGGLQSSRKRAGCPAFVWVEVWVEMGVVWVDRMCVGGMLKCPSLTRRFVLLRQRTKDRR